MFVITQQNQTLQVSNNLMVSVCHSFQHFSKGGNSEGAGKGWLYVEPDGDVLPSQGINHVLGNLLTDDRETIWSAAKAWRK